MRKHPSPSRAARHPALPVGTPILALEKRIAFDGAAAVTAAKMLSHMRETLHDNATDHALALPTHAIDMTKPELIPLRSGTGLRNTSETRTTTEPSRSVVFIESDVPDVKDLIKNVSPSAQIVILDAERDGVDAIASYLKGHPGFKNVYIFSHGSDAHLDLGSAILDSDTMQGRYASDLATIKGALGSNSNILIYGCDFAQNADGDSAARLLSSLTGASVAASTNPTGGTAEGGDFVLEDQIGHITAPDILNAAIATQYHGLLAAPTTIFANSGTGAYKSNLEFLTFANTSLVANGITNGATATYATSNGGTLKITFGVSSANATDAATYKPAPFSAYSASKLYRGYNNTSSTTEQLYGGFNGTAEFTITFSATDKNGKTYKPNIAFADSETTDNTESYVVTTTGGAFQNVETVGSTGYSLTGIGTQSFTLQNDDNGVPIITTTGVTTLDITNKISGGGEGFAIALINPTLSLDKDGSSGASANNYQTTFTERGSAVSIADTDTSAVEPGVTNATGATIVLTNAQAGDALTVGSLPSGITSSIDTSIAGQVTVTLSGSSSLANYDAAIQAIAFSNSSNNLSTVDRNIAVTFNDGAQDSNTAISTVHVTAVNDAPVETTPGPQTTNKDTVLSISGLSVSDVDANGGIEFVALSVSDGTISLASTSGLTFSSGTGTNDATMIFSGTLSAIDNAISTVTYLPKAGFYGSDSLGFVTNDNGNTGTGGAMYATKSVAITVNNVNPTDVGTIANQTYKDGQPNISIATARAFSDSLGLALTYSATGLPQGLSIDPNTGKITGTVDHDASTNAPAKTGSGATLDGTYTVVETADDGQGGSTTQTFTIDATNQAPVVGTKTANQTNNDGDTITAVDASQAFSDPNGDPLTYTASSLPSGLSISSTGMITGTVSKTAAPGTYSVIVTGTDDKGAATTETFSWVINDIPPTAVADTFSAPHDTASTINVFGNDSDALGRQLTITQVNGTAITAGGASVAVTGGTVALNSNGTLTYTPAAGYAGTPSFTYTIADPVGGTATATAGGTITDARPIVDLNGPQTIVDTITNGNALGSSKWSETSGGQKNGGYYFDADFATGSLSQAGVTGLSHGAGAFGAAQVSFGFAWNNGYPDYSAATVNVTVGGVVYAQIVTGSPGQDPNVATITYLNGAAGNLSSVLPTPYFNWSPVQLTLDLPANVANTGTVAFNVDASKSTDDVFFSNVSTTTLPVQPYGNAVNYQEKSAPVAIAASNASVFDGDSADMASATIVLTNDLAGDQLSIGGIAVTNGSTGTINGLTYTVTDSGGSETIALSGSATSATYQNTIAAIAYSNVNNAPSTVQRIVSVTTSDGIATSNTAVTTINVGDLNPSASGVLQNQVFADGHGGVSIATAGGFADPSGSPFTYSATGLPTGLSIDPTTGVISGSIDHDASANAPTKTGAGATLDGTYGIVVTATDTAGRVASQSFMIDATNQAPVVGTTTPDQTNFDGDAVKAIDVSTSFADPNGDPLTYTASNLPAGLSISGAGLITGTIARNAVPGTYAVTVTATDDKGAATPETFNWIVKDVPPTAVGTLPNQSFDDGQPGIAVATAQAFMPSNGNALTYSTIDLPKGLMIDAATGKITGTIDHDASKNAPVTSGSGASLDGTYTVTVVASDGLGGTATQSFTLDSTNQAPVGGAATPNQTANDGQAITPVDTAGVFSDPNAGDVLTFSATNLPAGLVIDAATGRISGTIAGNATPGVDIVRVIATDDKGAAARETFTWTVNDVAPTVSAPLANRAFADGQAPVSIATAPGFNSPNGLPLIYTATGLPPGLSIDSATGQITGALDHDASKNAPVSQGSGATLDGTYAVTIMVSDGQGGTASQSFHIDALNSAPTLVATTADQHGVDGNFASVDAAAAFVDTNTGDTLTYAATGLPPGLSIDPASGLITGTLAKNASKTGPYTITVTVTDDKGASTSASFGWTVEDVAPVATPPLVDRAAYDGASVSYTSANGFTNPNGLPLTYSATGLPSGLAIDPTTGLITGTLDHDASTMNGGVYAIAVSVDDGQGGTATNTFHLTATNQAPTLVAPTANQTTLDGQAIAPLNVTSAFTDPNGDPLTFTASNLPAGLVIDPSGVITGTVASNAKPGAYAVTVTAVDDKGAATPETFTWTIADVGPAVAAPLAARTFPDATGGITIATASGFASPIGLPLTYHVTGLPAGLTIDTATGLITGQIDHDSSANAPVQAGAGAALDGTYTVVVTADDGQGRTVSQSFTIDATNTAPVLANQTQAQAGTDGRTVSVDAAAAFSDPNIGDTLTYTVSGLPAGLSINPTTGLISGSIAANASQSGPYTVIVTATDDKGAATTELFTWSVAEVAPVAIAPLGDRAAYDGTSVNYSTASGFTNPNGLPLAYSATGLPSGLSINAATGVISGTLDHNASLNGTAGAYIIAVTVDDGQGGTATNTFHLTASNQAPVVTTQTANQASADGQTVTPLSLAPAFADPNGDSLTYTASGLPKGLSIDASGTISGTIAGNATPGVYSVIATATDPKGATRQETFTWTVSDAPPTIVGAIAPQTVVDSQAGISIATASAFANSNGLPVTYSATGLPDGLAINATTGTITGQIDHDASINATTKTGSGATLDGKYTVTVSVDDGQGGTTSQQFTIDSTNQAPVAATTSLDQHSTAGNPAQVNTAIAFSDPNNGDVLTYSATGLPTGLSINAATGLVTGTIDAGAGSATPYTVTITATDDKGATATKTVNWQVDIPTGTLPIPDISLYDGTTPPPIATASHFTTPGTLTYSATGLPPGLTIDSTSGIISGTIDHDASRNAPTTTGSGATLDGKYTVTVTATDGIVPSSQSFTIDVANQAPTVAQKTSDQTTGTGATIATVDTSLAFQDPNGDPLTYAASGLPAGLSFDTTTGKITGTTATTAAGTYAVTITATDDKGATTTERFQWTVSDTAPTVAASLPSRSYADSTTGISIATSGAFASPTGLTLTYKATGLPAGLTIDPTSGVISGALSHDASSLAPSQSGSGATLDGTYTVVVTASDGHGGSTPQTFLIDVANQAPTVGTATTNQHGADGATVSVDAARAFTDPNAGDILHYAASGLPAGLAIDPATGLIQGTIAKNASTSGPYTVMVTATDDKGATTSETFQWAVDKVAPVATPLGDRSAYDGTAVTLPTVTAFTNPNNQTLTYSATGLPAGLAIDPATGLISGTLDHNASILATGGVYTIAVTANDGQGGTAVSTFHLTATNQAPSIVATIANQTSSDGQIISPLETAPAFADPNGDTLTYSTGNLPAGLVINAATGRISGTVSDNATPGADLVTVTATDSKGVANSKTLVWTINNLAPAKIGMLAPQTYADSTGGIAIATAGSFANPKSLAYVYSATGLPAGLSINPMTGVISGQVDHNASALAPTVTGSGASLDGSYSVIVSATNSQGGIATQAFTIDARNTAPLVVAQTSDLVSHNGQSASLDLGSAFRDANVGDTLTFAASGLPTGLVINPATGLVTGTIDKAASLSGPYTVLVTATDNKGAATSETFTWTVTNIPPIATPPLPDLGAYDGSTLHLATSGGFTNPNALPFTYSATGLPAGLSIDPTTGVVSGTIGRDASVQIAKGVYTIGIIANDGEGGTATNTFRLTATNQAPLVATATPNQSATNGQTIAPINAATSFSDPNGDPLTFAAYNLPSGLTIDPASGKIAGTIVGNAAPGDYEVTIVATDDKGAANSETFHYLVGDTPPIATGVIPNQIYADSTGGVAIPTAAHFTAAAGQTLTFAASGLPKGLVLDPSTGVISGYIGHDASKNAPITTGFGATLEGIYTVTITASDGHGGTASRAFMIETTNQAPVVGARTSDQANIDGDRVAIGAAKAFTDPNLGDSLTYAATGLPKGLAIDPVTGLISGTIDKMASTSGPYSVVVTATDDKGAAVSSSFIWGIGDLAPTTTGALGPIVASDGAGVAPIDTASHVSNPNGLPLTYSATGLPPGLAIDPATGIISGTIDHDASIHAPATSMAGAGLYTIVVTASDGQGGIATQGFTIEAHNDAPVVVAPTANQASATSQSITPLQTASAFADPNGDPLSYTATGLPKGLAIDPVTGLISGTIDKAASALGPYSVVVTATDDKGAAAFETFVWSVADLAPTTSGASGTVFASDGTQVAPIDTALYVINPNGLPLTYSATGLPAGLAIDPATGLITGVIDHDASILAPMTSGTGAGVYTIVVTASDGQGGAAIGGFTIEVHNDAPVVVAQTGDQFGYTSQAITPLETASAFADPNGDPLTFAATGLPLGLAIDPATGRISGTIDKAASAHGPYTVVVTATDDKGAATSETFTATIADLAPTTTGAPATVAARDGMAIAPIDTASYVTNPNGLPLIYSAAGLPAGLTIDPATGSITGVIDHDASIHAPLTSRSGAGLYTIVVTVDDGQGGAATQSFIIEARNDAPALVAQTADQTGRAGQSVAPLDVASDFRDPNGDPLTFKATGLPPGLAIDPTTGRISGVIAAGAQQSSYQVVVTATDDKGATTSESFVWDIQAVSPNILKQPSAVPKVTSIGAVIDDTPPAPPAALHASGAVLEAINQISGDDEQSVVIRADEIVVSTVNNLRPLNGLQDLGGSGGIVRAGAATNEMGDRALRASTGGLAFDLSAQAAPSDYLGSSLRESGLFASDPGATINVETLIHDRVITIILDNTAPLACVVPVARYEVTSADGSALPEWLRPSAKGVLSGKIPPGLENMDLKVKATLANGIVSERHIKIGTVGGIIRPAGPTGRTEGRLLSDMVAAQVAPTARGIARLLPR